MSIRVSSRPLTLLVALVVLVALGVSSPNWAQNKPGSSPAALVATIKAGGYNFYVRHAATDWSQSDKIETYEDLKSCNGAEVRQLSDAGREQARRLGVALRKLSVPITRAFASPYCRTVETARLMTGLEVEATDDIMNLRSARFLGGIDAVVARARARLSQATPEGVNVLFVAHGNLGRAATGQSLAEGEILVLGPEGDSNFEIVGRLKLDVLETLAK